MHKDIHAAAIEEIQHVLREILSGCPDGISEHELLKELSARGLDLFDAEYFHSTLGLFQRHFLLFHCLYLLRSRMRASTESDMHIHCLAIRLMPLHNVSSVHPAPADPLAVYYLDLDNLKSTQEADVLQLLEDFWHRFSGEERRDEALAVMALVHPVSFPEIKQQYRRLAMQWHPDRGGDPENFQRLEWAMSVLRGVYQ